MRAILGAACLLLASLAFLPGAEARPVPPECAEKDVTGGAVAVGTNRSCGLDVDVDVMDCVWNGSWKTYQVGNSRVRVYTCDGPDPE